MHNVVHTVNTQRCASDAEFGYYTALCNTLGRMGRKKKPMTAAEMGRKGGAHSRKYMTPQERTALARKAAKARWEKKKSN
jgi:hypothetical protein